MFLLRLAFVVCIASALALAQENRCAQHGALLESRAWFAKVRLDRGVSFMATESRKQAILSGFEKVKIGMTTGEVEKLMTSPDFERIGRLSGVSGSIATGRPPEMDIGKGRCWYEWAYYISKSDLNPASSNDVGIFLQFS